MLKIVLENGETPIAIQQDFNATMYLANMVALAKKDADYVIQQEYKDKATETQNVLTRKRAL